MLMSSLAIVLMLTLAARADVADMQAAECRSLLERPGAEADAQFRELKCDAVMLRDKGTAQILVDYSNRGSPPAAPPDAAEPCRVLLRQMDQSVSAQRARQRDVQFERLGCSRTMITADRGEARVLVT